MYIIAKKKDYYDGVAGTTGIDKTIVYDREQIEFEQGDMPNVNVFNYKSRQERENSPLFKLGNSHIKDIYYKQFPHHSYFLIGFCGKLYPGFKLCSVKNTSDYDNVNITITFDKDYIIELFGKETYRGYFGRRYHNQHFEDNLNHVLQFDAMDWFREMKAPVFVYDEDYGRTHVDVGRNCWLHNHQKFTINPLLKEYEFYKIFDAFQAFQEISMFMGGVLGRGEKEIAVVADKYKIAQHGFDKWSFRKMPENGK